MQSFLQGPYNESGTQGLQMPSETEPLKTFITIEIEENSNEITLTNDNLLTAGQYENGSTVKLQMQEDIVLNNVKIAELLTVFISRNSDFDFNSNYQLIASHSIRCIF